MRYVHTNIISRDWRQLAAFYEEVFHCTSVPPVRDQQGDWLAAGTGVPRAALTGVHLQLPGYGANGPTLEIYSYNSMEQKLPPAANRQGLGHLAFQVSDVAQVLEKVIACGGKALGSLVRHKIPGQGILTFVYCCDPESNIIELQHWDTA